MFNQKNYIYPPANTRDDILKENTSTAHKAAKTGPKQVYLSKPSVTLRSFKNDSALS